MAASALLRNGTARVRRAAEGGCCRVRHTLITLYQRIAIWLAMMAMVGLAGLIIALGLRLIGSALPFLAQMLATRQA
jgi:hypothetical protein